MLRAINTRLASAASIFAVLFALGTLALSFCALPVLVLALFWLG